jgi:hypothetical protein
VELKTAEGEVAIAPPRRNGAARVDGRPLAVAPRQRRRAAKERG